MKNKIVILVAFLVASSLTRAEIVINDFLSFEGFVDMSYSHEERESKLTYGEYDANGNNDLSDSGDFAEGSIEGNGSDNDYGIDKVEISWLFDFDPITTRIDLVHEDSNGAQDTEVEQAFVTYSFDDGSAFIAGRFASMLGFEAFEPTGLYQKTFAYDFGYELDISSLGLSSRAITVLNSVVDGALPEYNDGVKYTYETDTKGFGIALLDGDEGERQLGGSDSGYAIEVAGAFDLGNGLGFFIGGRHDEKDAGDNQIINLYATYENGPWTYAAELVFGDDDAVSVETTQGLLMANYTYSDQASVTGRLSHLSAEVGADDLNGLKYTLAHNYAFTDNLALITEVGLVESEADGLVNGVDVDFDYDTLSFGVELLSTF